MKSKILPITVALCALLALVLVLILLTGEKEKDFTPPPFEQNAMAGIPKVPQEAGYAQADAEAFQFAAAGNLQTQDGSVDVWLTNPEGNDIWLKARILDKNGQVLGESGLVKEGEYVQTILLDTVPEHSTEVSLKIMAYEPQTYYSAGAAVLKTTLVVS